MLLLLALTPLYAAATATAVSGTPGYLAIIAGQNKPVVPGPALATPIGSDAVAVDSSGNVYIADVNNNVIEKVTPSGTLSILAGVIGHAGEPTPGPATSSDLDEPYGVAVDGSGNVYIADSGNDVIEKVTPAGTLSIVAGVVDTSGTPTAGPATHSDLNFPTNVAVDSSGNNIYIADTLNSLVEKVTSGTLSIFAGKVGVTGTPTPGPATSSALDQPDGVAVSSTGTVYIADTYNSVVEAVTSGTLSIFAGKVGVDDTPTPGGPATSSALNDPEQVAVDGSGNVYIADTYNSQVEKVTGGTLSIVAGSDADGAPTPGPATDSYLNNEESVAASGSSVYIADTGNDVVEKVTAGTLSIVAGILYHGPPTPGPATSSDLGNPDQVAIDSSGNVYMADDANDVIEKVTPTGVLSIVAGVVGHFGLPTAGPATSSDLAGPHGVAVDSAGNLYIADTYGSLVEKVTPTGTLSIVAGVSGHHGPPTPGPATSSYLDEPQAVAVDSSGDIYIADTANQLIEKVTPGGTLSIVAGIVGADGIPAPGPATSSHLNYPWSVAVDSSGNVYIADTANNVIEKVTPGGTLSIVAGVPGNFGGPTEGPATSSLLNNPDGVAVDGSGNVYIADTDNNVVEKVTPGGTLSIIAGGVNLFGPPVPGPATSSPLEYPGGVGVDNSGNVYIADSGNADVEELFNPSPAPPSSGGASTTTNPTTTNPSTTSATVTPTVKSGTASVTRGRISGRSVSDTVSCSGAGACTVSETLKAVETYKVGRKHKTTKHRTVTVGSDTVNVNGGLSLSVKVPLNGTGNALLREHGKLRATLTVTQGTQILRVQTVTYTKSKSKSKSKQLG